MCFPKNMIPIACVLVLLAYLLLATVVFKSFILRFVLFVILSSRE